MNEMTARYEDTLKILLADPDEAAAYLNAALDDGDQEVFLLALRDVAEARGMTNVARATRLNRESLYKMLSARGNPQLTSLSALLQSLGLRLTIAAAPPVPGPGATSSAIAESSNLYREETKKRS